MISDADQSKHAPPRWRLLRRFGLILAALAIILWMSGCMERLFYHPQPGPTPPPRHLRGVESVWFNSRDGTRLHGWFIPARPAGDGEREAASGGGAATILHVHGNAGNILSHIWFTEYLPKAGFNLFIFDYRGYGQSEGRVRTRGPLIEDTGAALDYLLARDDVDPRRIGVYGQSLGGSIALNVMADRSEIKAAVIESAFASWRDIAACALGGKKPGFVCKALSAIMIPDTHRPDCAIATIQRPMLLIHGDADSIIPIEHSRQLAAASNGSAKLVEVPGGDHNSLRDTNPEIESTVIDFFRGELQ
jgi:dipeptidyl aminopeptidase/acylaminoacyl peptidase